MPRSQTIIFVRIEKMTETRKLHVTNCFNVFHSPIQNEIDAHVCKIEEKYHNKMVTKAMAVLFTLNVFTIVLFIQDHTYRCALYMLFRRHRPSA